ncbi:hypothetical protein [Paraburkholderia youngii]|uniref:hypothetical protein n=1 Tax=Paraburkholderia youngii TaxID=2782701 RepID=UPI003D1DB90E
MKERPILFSGPMVRALLDGSKTQTRRIVKPQPDFETARDALGGETRSATVVYDGAMGGIGLKRGNAIGYVFPNIHCPYGKPGDRLWVRETFAHMHRGNAAPETRHDDDVVYKADGFTPDEYVYGSWKPSIHIPRWASRITLEVTGVRVERLQDISEADARAEGVTIEDHHMNGYCAGETRPPSICAFRELWGSIHGAESWTANPWVWVVRLKRVK